jgi:hypothetical protein
MKAVSIPQDKAGGQHNPSRRDRGHQDLADPLSGGVKEHIDRPTQGRSTATIGQYVRVGGGNGLASPCDGAELRSVLLPLVFKGFVGHLSFQVEFLKGARFRGYITCYSSKCFFIFQLHLCRSKEGCHCEMKHIP